MPGSVAACAPKPQRATTSGKGEKEIPGVFKKFSTREG